MRYLILGLGIYGSNLARDLTDMGNEVIGVDSEQSNIDAIKDYISTVYLVDVTEESALQLLPINNVDLVIVAIGENFGASIKVVAMLKKMKVKHIFARAVDELHESILQGFHIDRILTPEQRAARDLTLEIGFGASAQSLMVDDDNFVVKFTIPQTFIGLKYSDIDFPHSFKLNVIAIAHAVGRANVLGIEQPTMEIVDANDPNLVAMEGDQVTCIGSRRSFYSLFRNLQL